jgi:hypothetical protein
MTDYSERRGIQVDEVRPKELVVRLLPRRYEHEHHEQSNGYQAQDYTEPTHMHSP